MQREEEAINIDGLSVAEMKQMRESAEKHAFQAEVSRMMKLIINSLYKNKEVSILCGNIMDQKLFYSGQLNNFYANGSCSLLKIIFTIILKNLQFKCSVLGLNLRNLNGIQSGFFK